MKPAHFATKSWLWGLLLIALVLLVFAFFPFGQRDYRVFLVTSAEPSVQPVENPDAFYEHLTLEQLLQTEDVRQAGFLYVASLKANFLVPGTLDGADVVLVQDAPVCDRTVRKVLADFVKAGGKLIFSGNACTRVLDDASLQGWQVGQTGLSDILPATFAGLEQVDSKLRIYDIDHPLFNGIKNHDISGNIVRVNPVPDAQILAFINSTDLESGYARYGILEKRSGKGHVLYFAYDLEPSTFYSRGSRNLVLNALLYLTGPSR